MISRMSRKVLGYLCLTLISVTSLQVEGAPNLKTNHRLPRGEAPLIQNAEIDNADVEGALANNCTQYDYIIVGCGTAGAALARKLSDNFKNNVLVLETGPNNTHDENVLSTDILAVAYPLAFNPKYAFSYSIPLAIVPESPNFNFFQSIVYSAGRMLGGSSAHNFLLAVHGIPSTYDRWAALSGNRRWKYSNILPTIKGIETYTPDDTTPDFAQRGETGPIFVTQFPPLEPGNNIIDAIVKVTNAPFVEDYNDPPSGNIGTSAFQEFITPTVPPGSSSSIRSFSMNGYLPDDFANPTDPVVVETSYGLKGIGKRKLKVFIGAQVSRVLFKGKKAVGVEYILNSGKKEQVLVAKAKKKIILCAGAIHTPAILQRSGIGDKQLLNSLGIPVISANSNVGLFTSQFGILCEITGSLPEGFTGLQSMINLSPFYPNDDQRRVQILIDVFDSNRVVMDGFISEPQSQGSISIVSTDPITEPNLTFNFYSDGSFEKKGTDANKAVSFLRLAKEIANAAGEEVLFPTPETYASDQLLFDYAQSNPNLILADHMIGTTRMAKSKKKGVVDGNLHVFGVCNLMVADIGVIPVVDGNTCYPAYVVGEEAAKIIEEGAR